MAIYANFDLSPGKKQIRTLEIADLTDFILGYFGANSLKITSYNEHPSETLGEKVDATNLTLDSLFSEQIFSEYYSKSDYMAIEGLIGEIPYMLVLTNNKLKKGGFEHEHLYFTFFDEKSQFTVFEKFNYSSFFKNLMDRLEQNSTTLKYLFVGETSDVITYWDEAWGIWFSADYEFMYRFIDYLRELIKYSDIKRDWLEISIQDLQNILHLLKFMKSDMFAGLFSVGQPILRRNYSKNKKIEPLDKELPLMSFMHSTKQRGMVNAEIGSIGLFSLEPNYLDIRKAINFLLQGLLYSITESVDIQKIGREIIKTANEYFNRQFDDKL